MFSIFLLKIFQNYLVFVMLAIALVSVVYIYLFDYFKICYYATKFPGPKAFPIIGNMQYLRGSNEDITHRTFLGVFNEYSVLRFWLGPLPVILTSNPDIVQEVLTNGNLLEKSKIMKLFWNFNIGKSILTTEVPEWKNHRNIVIRGFSPAILESFFPIFVEKIQRLTSKLDLELNNEASFDVFPYLSNTTLDTVCDSSMGLDIDTHEHGSDYRMALKKAFDLMAIRLFSVFKIPHQIYRLTKDNKEAFECRTILCKFTDNVILNKRNEQPADVKPNYIDLKGNSRNEYKKPLLEYLMHISEINSDFNDEHMRNEVNLIIIAAHETSATALSNTLIHLASYKDVQRKLYAEICEVLDVKSPFSINFNDLPKLTYMDMVIKESMRLIATIPLIGREVSKDFKIGKYMFPKGLTVGIPICALHLNKDYWENPLKFDPERFTSENIKNQHPYSYIPFSGGPRNCIGKRYAWIFMKVTLAILLSKYEFHTDLDLDKLRFEFTFVSFKLTSGYQIRITPRQNVNN